MKSAIVPTQRLQRHAKRQISVPVLGQIPDVSTGQPPSGAFAPADTDAVDTADEAFAAETRPAEAEFGTGHDQPTRTTHRHRSMHRSDRGKHREKASWPLSNYILVGIAVLLVLLLVVLMLRKGASNPEPLPGEWPQNLDHIADSANARHGSNEAGHDMSPDAQQGLAGSGGAATSELTAGQPIGPLYEPPTNPPAAPILGDPSAGSDPPGVARLTGTIGKAEFQARQTPQPPTTY